MPMTPAEKLLLLAENVKGMDLGPSNRLAVALKVCVEGLEKAESAIRAACSMCDGAGAIVIETSRADHAPDCDGRCRNCPVEVQVQDQEGCEYCGRPIDALRAHVADVLFEAARLASEGVE